MSILCIIILSKRPLLLGKEELREWISKIFESYIVKEINTTIDILREFDKLPYTHKVAMSHLPHPELKSVCYIKGFSEEGQLGNIFTFSGWFGKKYYDQFDWVKFFCEA